MMMKWIACLTGLLICSLAYAVEPVTLSQPVPALTPSYSVDTSNTVIYSLTNNVPLQLPLTISNFSNGVSRTLVGNDCGDSMPAGPSNCNIGVVISPTSGQIGSSLSQVLAVNYQGRAPLTSPISYSVIQSLAYVSPSPGSSEILQFSMDTSNGKLLSNVPSYSSMTEQYEQLTFAVVGGVQYAYAVDQTGFVYQCNINADGTFNTCSGTPPNPPAGWGPHGIAFATVAGVQYAYITDINIGNVYQCSLNVGGSSNGSFNTCLNIVGTAFNAPYGIDFATVGGVQYAYIAEAVSGGISTGNVYQCSLNGDGSFNTCTTTPQLGTPAWIPYAVAFATSGGTQYAYVADNGTTPIGNVYKCTLHNDGSFNTCAPTPSVGAPTVNWAPSDLAFVTLNGTQYAYITNYQGVSVGSMYVCTVGNDGSFSGCIPTPSAPYSPPATWQPVGVAFRF
jgi:hypothetical protein